MDSNCCFFPTSLAGFIFCAVAQKPTQFFECNKACFNCRENKEEKQSLNQIQSPAFQALAQKKQQCAGVVQQRQELVFGAPSPKIIPAKRWGLTI